MLGWCSGAQFTQFLPEYFSLCRKNCEMLEFTAFDGIYPLGFIPISVRFAGAKGPMGWCRRVEELRNHNF